MRDTSLKVPPGVQGTVVEVRVFNRRGVEKDERAIAIERAEIERLAKDRDDEKAILERNIYSRLREVLDGQVGDQRPARPEGRRAARRRGAGRACSAACCGRSASTTPTG